jgi:CRP-like cAMP-binding protein
MYIGAVFLAFTIATLGNIISNLDLAGSAFHQKRKQLEQYITSKGLPPDLRDHVLQHFQVRFSDRKVFDDSLLLSVLSDQVQQKVMLYNHRGLIESVPLLNSKSHRFVMSICRALELEIFSMGDVVLQEGSVGDQMYFIYSGLVEIVSKYRPASVVAAIGDGCYFGDVAVMLHAPNSMNTNEEVRYERRSATARAKTLLVLYKIHRDALFESLQDFTTIHEYMFGVAEERRTRVRRLQAAPKDDHVTQEDTEDAKTELFASTHKAAQDMIQQQRMASAMQVGKFHSMRQSTLWGRTSAIAPARTSEPNPYAVIAASTRDLAAKRGKSERFTAMSLPKRRKSSA